MNDPIVEEIRRFRKEHAAQHGNDLKRIAAALREKERASGREYLNPGPKRLEKKIDRAGCCGIHRQCGGDLQNHPLNQPVASGGQRIFAHHSEHQLGRRDNLQQRKAGARGRRGQVLFSHFIQESGLIMSGELQITVCPSCGSGRIERAVRDVVRRHEGQEYVVPAVTFYECPDCGEKVYDREAMLKIEACSPAYKKEKEKAKSSARGRMRSTAAGKLVQKKSAA